MAINAMRMLEPFVTLVPLDRAATQLKGRFEKLAASPVAIRAPAPNALLNEDSYSCDARESADVSHCRSTAVALLRFYRPDGGMVRSR